MATRSLVVVTEADRMFTCWSESTRVTSDNSRDRSSASTWMATRNTEDADGAHSTSTIRSGCAVSDTAFTQSARCTDTPLPRVTKPTMLSPGTGVQQRASFTQMSEAPLTTTPGSVALRRLVVVPGRVTSARSSLAPSSPPSDSTRRDTTDWAETWL